MLTREDKEREKSAVGERVRRLREKRQWSPATLAAHAGLPRQYVYDLEAGERCSIANVVGVARALGVSTDYLLGLENHGLAHACCVSAAERDVWIRERLRDPASEEGRILVRHLDGSYRTLSETLLAGGGSILQLTHGERVTVVRCGEYQWRGQTYRVGQDYECPLGKCENG